MQISITLIGIIIAVVAIWIIFELKRGGVAFKHRFFAIFLIVLLLFTYFSFTFVLGNKNLDLSSWNGIKQAGAVYYSWLSSVFVNFKTLTTNAIHMNWGAANSTLQNATIVNLSNSS